MYELIYWLWLPTAHIIPALITYVMMVGVGLFTIQCLVFRRVLLTCSFQTSGVLAD